MDWTRFVEEWIEITSIDAHHDNAVEEIAQHLDDRCSELIADGVPLREAVNLARQELDELDFGEALVGPNRIQESALPL
mgnify:CR=1 FL=1